MLFWRNLMATSSLTIGTLGNYLNTVVATQENAMAAKVAELQAAGENVSTIQLLEMQQSMTQWTMTTDLQSQMMKTLSDTLKSIIQKSG
jgi:type III secretion protein F